MKKELLTPAFKRLLQDYVTFIKAKGFKGKCFVAPIRELLNWMEDFGITNAKDITTKEIMAYYRYLIERPNQKRAGTLSGSTIKTHLLSLSFFLDNLLEDGQIERAFVIPKFSSDDQKPRNILSIEEIKALFTHTENHLEKALLSVAYGCGLRRSEMENLNGNDVQLSNGMLVVRSGKGSKRREVPMSDTVLRAVKDYVLEYRYPMILKSSATAFFLNKKGQRMSGEAMNKLLKKIIQRTRNQVIIDKEITLHCLRHSIAHHLMENNAGIDFIKGFLGHSFINTSYIYAIKNKKMINTANHRYK